MSRIKTNLPFETYADSTTLIEILWEKDEWFIIKDKYILPSEKPTATLCHRCAQNDSHMVYLRSNSTSQKCSFCSAEVPELVNGFFNMVKWGIETEGKYER